MSQQSQKRNGQQEDKLTIAEQQKFSNMAKFLSRSFVQTQTFGIRHPLAIQPIEQCYTLLSRLIQEKGNILLYIAEKKLRYGQTILAEKNSLVDRLIKLFSAVQLASLEFEQGFSRDDFLRLLSIFTVKPEGISALGGVVKLVKEKNIAHLKVNPIKYELIRKNQRVVSEESRITEETLAKMKKQLAKTEAKSAEREKPKDELLSLIDETLKEDVGQSAFVQKLTENPLEVVHSIARAIRLVNKAGGENAKAIISSIINKLALVGDNLYECLSKGKADKATKATYKAAAVLVKELTKRIKDLRVSAELGNLTAEMKNVLTVVSDQIEAQKILSAFFKGRITVKKQADLLKKISRRQQRSPEFELLMSRLLILKGMSEEEVRHLIDAKERILAEAEEAKQASLTTELNLTLQRLSEKRIDAHQALTTLKDVVSRAASAKMQAALRKLKEENQRLLAYTKIINSTLDNMDRGIIILDAGERITYINQPAREVSGLKINEWLDKQLLSALKNWPNKISKEQQAKFGRILSHLKSVQKDAQDQINSVIFNPT